MTKQLLWASSFALISFAAGSQAHALEEENVLVVYNSADAESVAVYDYYLQTRPGVIGYDLNDPTVSGTTLTYSEYTSKLRDPIRAYLTGQNLEQQVSVITLTKGIPHRIEDRTTEGPNDTSAGSSPGVAGILWENGQATYASVDSELTLLWQDLETGYGDDGKLLADNGVVNPYYGSSATQPIMSYDRSDVAEAQRFVWTGSSFTMQEQMGTARVDAGAIMLTARLDGYTVDDVKGMIDRAQNPVFNSENYKIVLDENSAGELDGGSSTGDYDSLGNAFPYFYPAGVFDDNGAAFLVGENEQAFEGTVGTEVVEGPVAALLTYGGNHNGGSGDNLGFLQTWEGQLVDGAIYNGLESFSARNFNGIDITNQYNDQGQLADWIAYGGTFGTGTVYEPFTFGVADNTYLILKMLQDEGGGYTGGAYSWVEAAWASIPYLSWQNLVLGDPLATISVTEVNLGDVPGDFDLNAFIDGRDLDLLAANFGNELYDLDGDSDADADDLTYWIRDLYGSELGDVNLDHSVDLLDLSILATNFEEASEMGWADGDLNGDGAVDLLDLSILASYFGFGSGESSSLPEPGLGLLVALPLVLRRR